MFISLRHQVLNNLTLPHKTVYIINNLNNHFLQVVRYSITINRKIPQKETKQQQKKKAQKIKIYVQYSRKHRSSFHTYLNPSQPSKQLEIQQE